MRELFLQRQLHELLCRRGHILEALPEGNNREAEVFEVLRHLHCAPAVKGNLADVVLRAKLLNELFDVAISLVKPTVYFECRPDLDLQWALFHPDQTVVAPRIQFFISFARFRAAYRVRRANLVPEREHQLESL